MGGILNGYVTSVLYPKSISSLHSQHTKVTEKSRLSQCLIGLIFNIPTFASYSPRSPAELILFDGLGKTYQYKVRSAVLVEKRVGINQTLKVKLFWEVRRLPSVGLE